jgi:hypothetical protein
MAPTGAIIALLEGYIELHDFEAGSIGGYQESLDIMHKMHRPFRILADKYVGTSDEMDKLVARMRSLTFQVAGEDDEDKDEGIPF